MLLSLSHPGVDRVPVMTSLQCTQSVGDLLTKLHDYSSRLNIAKFHKYLEAGLEADEFKETLDSLKTLAENYEDNRDM